MVTRGLKERVFAQMDHGSYVTCLEDSDTEEEGEKGRGEDREVAGQRPAAPVDVRAPRRLGGAGRAGLGCPGPHPTGSPKGRGTAPGSAGALRSGTLPQL